MILPYGPNSFIMRTKTAIFLFPLILTLAACSTSEPAEELDVIPQPNYTELKNSAVSFENFSGISCSKELSAQAAFLREELRLVCGRELGSGSIFAKKVRLVYDDRLSPESYEMKVSSRKIEIRGDAEGVFYGIQTLLQQILDDGKIQKGIIKDAPRYHWRGFMLDEARHFFGKEEVKRLLDMMAYLKLNKFHWHLTDAQGWRIEIKAYPELALTGGVGTHSDPDVPAQFYTQEDIREIVSYAAQRHIEIIPEIDMPGHASAANRAYPEFNGGGSGQFPDFTFNVGKEGTYKYLCTILKEVGELFPSKYIHIGGDEVFYGSEAWKKDPYVQELMSREGLADIKAAEGYFINRICDSLKTMGKTMIAWDDVLGFTPDKEHSVICWWRHDRPQTLLQSLDLGYSTILCPRKPMYYDFVQHSSHTTGRTWDGFCPLEDVYAFPDAWYEGWGVEEKDMEAVIGIQSNLWTELVHNTDRLYFMIYPRLFALSEAAWTEPGNKDYESFSRRMEGRYSLMDQLGIYYFDDRDPSAHPEPSGPVIKKR